MTSHKIPIRADVIQEPFPAVSSPAHWHTRSDGQPDNPDTLRASTEARFRTLSGESRRLLPQVSDR